MQGVKQVLVKLGERGSLLLTEDGNTIVQPAILASNVVDTTGAGDTFTAAYAVALVEGQSLAESLRFASNSQTYGFLCEIHFIVERS